MPIGFQRWLIMIGLWAPDAIELFFGMLFFGTMKATCVDDLPVWLVAEPNPLLPVSEGAAG
jgi:hypothetical protein